MADEHKKLKPFRSQAERTRVHQGWVVIALAILQLTGTIIVVLLQLKII